MAPIYLSGIFTAWCVTQLALGVFFGVAYATSRRERDLAAFGLMCVALAYQSASSARAHLAMTVPERLDAVTGVIGAGLLAAAANVHFAATYAGFRQRRPVIIAAYGTAGLFEIVNSAGLWWEPGTGRLVDTLVFGHALRNWAGQPTAMGQAGFAFLGVCMLAGLGLIAMAWRSGRREAPIALVGGLALVATAVNDMALSAGLATGSSYLVPHGFMLYAFAVASTLVARHRLALGDLLRTEGELRRATEELRVSSAELHQAQDELATKRQLAAVGELAAAIAHEVRNPLAVIMNAVAGLRRAPVADQNHEVLLNIVEEESVRLNQLVADLLRFARPTTLKVTAVDLAELLRQPGGDRSPKEPFELELGDGLPETIEADPVQVRVALDNLLQNAAQAMTSTGPIRVVVSHQDVNGVPGVRIAVRDTGSGMPAEVMARARDPFFTTRPAGTGLGLPIVLRIVEAHHGGFELESESGRGTTAALWLPVHHGSGAPSQRP